MQKMYKNIDNLKSPEGFNIGVHLFINNICNNVSQSRKSKISNSDIQEMNELLKHISI